MNTAPKVSADDSDMSRMLFELHAIQQLKYRYVRAIDTHDWDLMAECFAEDAQVWYNSGLHKRDGRQNILEFFRSIIDTFLFSSHTVMHPEISLAGPTTATGIWRIQDIVFNTQPDPKLQQPGKILGGQRLDGAGYYHDDYVKIAGKWVIQSTGFVRIFEAATRPNFSGEEFLRTEAKRGMK